MVRTRRRCSAVEAERQQLQAQVRQLENQVQGAREEVEALQLEQNSGDAQRDAERGLDAMWHKTQMASK